MLPFEPCQVRHLLLRAGIAACVLAFSAAGLLSAQDDLSSLQPEIQQLTRQLNDDQSEARDQAEQNLLKLAPVDNAEQCDAFLDLLPRPREGMPEEVRLRLTRIRSEIENRQASQALSASRFSLSADAMDLASVFAAINTQTSNQLSDHREQFGQDATPRPVTIEIEDEEFWPAIDKILDQTKLSLYGFSGEKTLAVVNGEPGAAARSARASYAGPFRIEATEVVAQRNLRTPSQQGARVELEIAWEPRLKPIAISQPIESIEVTGDDGSAILPASPQAVLNVEVPTGSHSTELVIPLALPSRSVKTLATFRGELSALVPGRVVEFQFKDLDKAEKVEQRRGGVKVILDRLNKNQALWEVHMRLQVESEEAGLESHRGWVFQNITYLLNPQGEIVDHAGFETTRQTKNEVGLAYFFDLPDDDNDDEIDAYTWVYRTPAAIIRVPVKYELKDIPLP
jgi:hypothetical protein